jgi:pSer/pThr/pTyr-binding forkhead associated (FHA) protein
MAAKAAGGLERIAADSSPLAVPVHALPFGIGRDGDNELVVVAPAVSRKHARLTLAAGSGRLLLSDPGSTNRSFVNRVGLIGSTLLDESDSVHLGSVELRLRRPVDSL